MPIGEIKYFSEFLNKEDQQCRIDIYDRDGLPFSEIEIQMMDNPVIVEHPETDRYEPMRTSGLTMRVLNTKAQGFLFYADLFGTGETQHNVVLTVDGNIKWQGWIIPEIYDDQLDFLPKPITIACTDGLTFLKNIDLLVSDAPLLSDIIFEILRNTGLDLKVLLFCNLATSNMDSALNAYVQTFIDSLALVKSNGDFYDMYTILREIIKPFGGSVFQKAVPGDGVYWAVDRLRMSRDTRTFQAYDHLGVFDKDIQFIPIDFTIPSPTRVLKGAGFTYYSGYRYAELDVDLQQYSNLITPAVATVNPTEFGPGNAVPATQIVAEYHRWYHSDTITLFDTVLTAFESLFVFGTAVGFTQLSSNLSIDGVETGSAFSYQGENEVLSIKVGLELVPSQLELIVNSEFRNIICCLEIEVSRITSTGLQQLGWLVEHELVNNVIDGNLQFAQLTDDDYVRVLREHVYDPDTNTKALENRRVDFTFDLNLQEAFGTSFGDFEVDVRIQPFWYDHDLVEADLLDINGPAKLLTGPGYHIIEYNVNMQNAGMDNVVEGEINSSFTQRFNEKLLFGDVDNLNFKNGFFDGPLNRTALWFETGTGGSLSLLDRWLLDIMQNYHIARFKMAVEARSGVMNYEDFVIEDQVTNKTYYITGYKWNVYYNVIQLQLAEFVKDDGVTIAP